MVEYTGLRKKNLEIFWTDKPFRSPLLFWRFEEDFMQSLSVFFFFFFFYGDVGDKK